MTNEKLKSVFTYYFGLLNKRRPGCHPRQLSDPDETRRMMCELPESTRTAHYMFMCEEAKLFVDAGRVEKAMRWLGFLQGVLWSEGLFTLNDLKDHSRP